MCEYSSFMLIILFISVEKEHMNHGMNVHNIFHTSIDDFGRVKKDERCCLKLLKNILDQWIMQWYYFELYNENMNCLHKFQLFYVIIYEIALIILYHDYCRRTFQKRQYYYHSYFTCPQIYSSCSFNAEIHSL